MYHELILILKFIPKIDLKKNWTFCLPINTILQHVFANWWRLGGFGDLKRNGRAQMLFIIWMQGAELKVKAETMIC